MKKKILSGLLAITMALTPIGVAGAEFTDGNMTEKANEILAGEETFIDKATSTEAGPFTDSEVLSEEESVAVEDINVPAAYAQNLYQVSVSGELILSETQKFVKLLNAERAKLGVPPVQLDQRMMEIAKERAIQGSIVYGHYLPNGTNPTDFFECVAMPFSGTAVSFFTGWENSPGHWKLLTNSDYEKFGFAIFKNEESGYYSGCAVGQSNHPAWPPLSSYTGGFNDDNKLTYSTDIINTYLQMKREKTSLKINNKRKLRPIYNIYDSEYNSSLTDLGYTGCHGVLNNNCGIWESDNPAVATIDTNGNLKALKGGTAKIRFYVNGDRDKYYENIITVKSQPAKPKTPVVTGAPYKYSQVKLTWEKEEGRFIGYQIYKYNNRSKKYELYAKPEGNITTGGYSCKFGDKITFTDKNGYGKTVKYKIRTYRTDLDSEKTFFSSYSDIITVKTAPAATTITKATAGNGSVSLTWKKAAGAEYYQIYRAASKNGTYSKVKTVKGSVLTYKNTGLKRGKTYYYKVRSYRVQPNGKKVYSKFSSVIGKKTK